MRMPLGAADALVPVDSGALPTLDRGAQRTTIDKGDAGLRVASGRGPHEEAQILGQGFTAAGGDRHGAPVRTMERTTLKTSRREDLAQVVAPLRRRLGRQTLVGRDELPLFIADIAGIGASVHARILHARRCQVITPSKYPPHKHR
jgi:hypothetical protein